MLVLTLRWGVDFSRWTDTWWGTGRLLCKPEPRPEVVGLWISCIFGNYWWCQGGCLNLNMSTGCKSTVYVCISVAANHLPSSFLSRAQIKQWNYVLFQEGGIQIWSIFAVFIAKFLSPAALHLLSVCFFFPDPTVKIESTTMRHLRQIFHIMFFVFTRSVCLFLARRQLHKMMLRSMRRLGGIIFSHSSQQSYSFFCMK